jgi:hypothetical protein
MSRFRQKITSYGPRPAGNDSSTTLAWAKVTQLRTAGDRIDRLPSAVNQRSRKEQSALRNALAE